MHIMPANHQIEAKTVEHPDRLYIATHIQLRLLTSYTMNTDVIKAYLNVHTHLVAMCELKGVMAERLRCVAMDIIVTHDKSTAKYIL
jgi:hypothetical protein